MEDRVFFIDDEAAISFNLGLTSYNAGHYQHRYALSNVSANAAYERFRDYQFERKNTVSAFRAKLKDNLRSPVTPTYSHTKRTNNQTFGHALALLIAQDDEAGICYLIEEYADTQAVCLLNSTNCKDIIAGQYTICDRCGAVEHNDNLAEVNTRRHSSESWCSSCVDSNAVTCDDCGDLWDADRMHHISGNGVCPSCFNENYFTCDSCGDVYSNDEYAEDGVCTHCYNADNEDESSDGLRGYHDTSRDWEVQNDTPDYPYADAPPLGVELEVYCENRADVVYDLQRNLDGSGDWAGQLILEEDGSLDGRYGFEIVTDPLGLSEHQQYTPNLIKVLKSHTTKAWDATGGRYGIHVTVSRSYLSPLQEARMMMFLCASDNCDFVQAISQRENIYNPKISIGSLARNAQTIYSLNDGNGMRSTYRKGKPCKKIYGAGKYAPINFKDNLAEFRIFQATIHQQSYLKCVEFVSALIEWTSLGSATGSSWYHLDFLEWIAKRPLTRKQYPNLVGFLERPAISVKGRSAITNRWVKYMPVAAKVKPEPAFVQI